MKTGRPRVYSDDQLLATIRAQAHELGRTPYHYEARPNHNCYIRRFGSWRRAVELAGLVPRPQGGSRSKHCAAPVNRTLVEETERKRLFWLTQDRSLVA